MTKQRFSFRATVPLAALASAVVLPAMGAAVAAPPAKKPVSKPAQPGVKGTAQLPGDVGQIGVTYSLGSGDDTRNLTIHDMYYVASRLNFNGKVVYPDADKKFLVMDYTIQNPNHVDTRAYTQTYNFTAVDAANKNWTFDYNVMDMSTGQDLDTELKPGQKVDAKAYLVVPADIAVPKLILDYGGPKVMRFDLHGVVKPVEAVVHDPADTTGTLALATIPSAQVGTAYPCGPFDMAVEKFEFTTASLGGNAPDDGKRYLVATLRARNMTKEDQDISTGNGFTAFVMDGDGDKTDWTNTWLKVSADEQADSAVAPGIEKRVRIYWTVSKSTPLKTVTIYLGDAYRHLVYDVSGVK